MSRFNYGDRVEVNGHQGKITSIWFNLAGDRITNVVFDDKTLIPPEMEVLEKNLKEAPKKSGYYGGFYGDMYDYSEKYGPVDEVCPKCGTKWTITKSPTVKDKVWKDCNRCKKKYEELI